MRRFLVGGLIAAFLVGGLGCASRREKREQEAAQPATAPEQGFALKPCPLSRIEVTPQNVDDPQCVFSSDCAVELTATAYDQAGQAVDVPLAWRFREPDGSDEKIAGAGHRLEVLDNRHARVKASGIAAGLFGVVVRDQSCNQGTEAEPQYVEGVSWVAIHDRPGLPAVCGRMRVTYGDRIDRMGDTVIASSKVTLIAELSGPDRLARRFKVLFYINDKKYPGRRPLTRDPGTPTAPGQAFGYISVLPMFLVPGDYRIRYELVDQAQVICGSKTERFKAK